MTLTKERNTLAFLVEVGGKKTLLNIGYGTICLMVHLQPQNVEKVREKIRNLTILTG